MRNSKFTETLEEYTINKVQNIQYYTPPTLDERWRYIIIIISLGT